MRPVLVADDSAVARLAVTRRLRARKIAIVEADTAELARTVDPNALSCALLDLDLGDGDGADVAALLRRSASALPIAFFSAAAVPELIERARAYGPVFHKPDDLENALAWVVTNANS